MSGIVGQNPNRGSGVIGATAIADDAIDSEHYADGSIDNAHIADDAIDSEHYAAGSIDEAHIADNAVTLAKMASGTDGNIISFDASGNPVAIATGNDGQVLTSTGAGSPPAFEAAGGGGLESGTVAVFFQSGAPTDWTKSTANNDKMLRVVSGTGGGTGGTAAISSPAHSISAAAHTVATSEMPAHTHTADHQDSDAMYRESAGYSDPVKETAGNTGSTGGGGSHTHSGTGSITTPAYMDVIIATKD